MLSDEMKKHLVLFLEDDHAAQDTTSTFTPEMTDARAVIKANEPATLAGVEEALFLFAHLGLTVVAKKNDGDVVHPGNILLEATGSNRAILSIERTVLNVLGRMSGVATLCRHAQQMAGKNTEIALTRKTIPGFNLFDKKAAEIAGIWPHRLHLEDAVLIKENHLRFFASAADAVLAAHKSPSVKTGGPNGPKIIEIEVQTLDELKSAVTQKPDLVLLDNFSLPKAETAVKWCRSNAPDVQIELSGGIRLSNLAAFAVLQPDYISLGLLTKEARTVDFSLDFI
ncbi:carboxylating nicotinate-nucleotide diphosphorylase [Candidatus Micrarchaeota archaeon]|nr:carboxylating nicotinate-nucleotide diphosphorylase [Candidatus Micrarchaeota archaeon]